MQIVVTGAAGFIGSNLVRALNVRGDRDIIAVDNLTHADKVRNLADCDISEFVDKDDFLDRLLDGDFDDVEAVLHQGACSDTMESDGRYMMRNNYRYSRTLVDWCQDEEVPLLYASSASVYGSGTVFREERVYEAPLNVYAYSKALFDQYVRTRIAEGGAQIVGFRYFNVYGQREQHKGRGSSVAFHFFNQYRAEGKVRLFESSGGYANGEQRRDFVHVDDIVRANLFFLDHPELSGIFNCGTGRAQSFNDVAVAVLNALHDGPPKTVAEWVNAGRIEYIPFPAALAGKYQSFTQAELMKLRAAGYATPFASVEEGVAKYVKHLAAEQA
jgi:ADP-L-glycero-D-manno-heptose 6-epimerase